MSQKLEMPAWIRILLYINNNNHEENFPLRISQRLQITNSHVLHILNNFEKEKMLASKKKGRIRFFSLTKKGKEVINSAFGIYQD